MYYLKRTLGVRQVPTAALNTTRKSRTIQLMYKGNSLPVVFLREMAAVVGFVQIESKGGACLTTSASFLLGQLRLHCGSLLGRRQQRGFQLDASRQIHNTHHTTGRRRAILETLPVTGGHF